MTEQNNLHTSETEELSLKDMLLRVNKEIKFILGKWVVIAMYCFICGAVGLAYSILKKPIYKAELKFALEESKSSGALGSYSGLASQFGLDVGGGGGGAFSGDNLIELMKSRSMVEKALLDTVKVNNKTETLAEFYIDFNNLRDKWSSKPELANIHFLAEADRSKFTLKQDSLLGQFHKDLIFNNLTVDKIDKKLSIVVVTVNSKNELFSKLFTENLANEVSQFYIETKTKKFARNVNILQFQTDSVRHQLNSAITGVASSLDVNPNANPARQILRTPAQYRQVDIQVNTAILAELVKNLEVARVSLRNETPLIQIIDKPILPLDIERVGKLKGILVGVIVGFFLAIFGIVAKQSYKAIMG